MTDYTNQLRIMRKPVLNEKRLLGSDRPNHSQHSTNWQVNGDWYLGVVVGIQELSLIF